MKKYIWSNGKHNYYGKRNDRSKRFISKLGMRKSPKMYECAKCGSCVGEEHFVPPVGMCVGCSYSNEDVNVYEQKI